MATSSRRRAEARGAWWLWAAGVLLLLPAPASAQLGRQLETRGVSWTPTVALREVGTDSNVFIEPGEGRGDRTAIFTPSATAKMESRLLELQGNGQLDFVYFEKFVQERSLNRKADGRVQFDFGRFTPFLTGMIDRGRERQLDVDLRIARRRESWGGGVAIPLTAKGSIEGSFVTGKNTFDPGATFRDVEVARGLDRRNENLNIGFRYAFTSLTTIGIDASRIRDYYTFDRAKDTDDRRLFFTLFLAPDAVIKGRIVLGYHQFRAQFPAQIPSKGVLADANVGYTFRESSRFNLRYFRDTSASFDSPFNLQTQYGIDLIQDIAGPLKATAGASRQFVRHAENPAVKQQAQNERYDSYQLGLAFYWSTAVRSTVSYDNQRRRSTIESGSYRRRRLLASLSFVL